jgi:hypothetical protein
VVNKEERGEKKKGKKGKKSKTPKGKWPGEPKLAG